MLSRPRARGLLGVGAAALAALLTVSGAPLAGLPTVIASTLPASAAPAIPPPAVAPDAEADPDGARPLTVEVLSSRPDTVTAGTALVRVALPASVEPHLVRLTADGSDVTGDLRTVVLDDGGLALEGVVTELPEGASTLVATVRDSDLSARLPVTGHPAQGPVFSGPHQEPFVCDTDAFALHGGGTLGPALDADCSARTVERYMYRTTGGAWEQMPDPDRVPSDAAETTVSTGRTVPFTVRVLTGTANRSIYETAVLYTPGEERPDPWHRPAGWNGRLVFTFGGGCAGGWYVQGRSTAGVLDPGMLGRGYAVASSSLNVFGHNCNDLLAAESAAAVKERFVLTHGVPDATLGWGNSGGAYQAHQIADNQPGLLDGIVVAQSFPDVVSSVVPAVADARLLHEYARAHPGALTREQQTAVSGFGHWAGIERMADSAVRLDPMGTCPDQLPEEERYHPEHRPDGARCELFAHTVNVYGTDPDTGLPRRPLDNVGVQYGLGALLDGTLDVDAFLHLNEHIGGLDADARVVGERIRADPGAVVAAHRTGRVLHTGGGLAEIPVVDYREYQDDTPGGDIHQRYHSFSTRARMLAANGHADNHVMLVESRDRGRFSASAPVPGRALAELDAWVSGVREREAAHPGRPRAEHVRAARPEWLVDSCWIGDGADAERVVAEQRPLTGGDRCSDAFPVHTSPRTVAGAPLSSDVLACRLRPFDAAEHPADFDEGQAARAARIFAEGICDHSVPGRGQQAPAGTWIGL
ncbi:hypothetical protein DFP74_4721 [Nocardiopsis sp. Huas11]|uniref:DUF6351 family protein n=1 Tax=Nocardiopsis sp. Huas11 TaxID=2183912 RepID=UPI000F286801|nr:DUF6351 family protein [Nocardiopsis sp. Huas11]RKS08993.1 hypothetical protein DFP74_4721 [Nocardiopsis sp. Huas11]